MRAVILALVLAYGATASAQDTGAQSGVSGGFALTMNTIGRQADTHIVDVTGVIRVASQGTGVVRPMMAAHVTWPWRGLRIGPMVAGALSDETLLGAAGTGILVEVADFKFGVGAWFERGDILGDEFVVGQAPPVDPATGEAAAFRYTDRGYFSTMVYLAIPTGLF